MTEDLDARFSTLEKDLMDADREIASLRKQLASIRGSMSWRVTKPLRAANAWVKRGARRRKVLAMSPRRAQGVPDESRGGLTRRRGEVDRKAGTDTQQIHEELGRLRREVAAVADEVRKETQQVREGIQQVRKESQQVQEGTQQLRKETQQLRKRSGAVQYRLEVARRELEVWRYMAWLERARPASERLVSVITATRNRADLLERCIDSVLAQAHTEFELVVVDDGSDDSTPDVLARFADPRVRSFRIDHAGVCAARNHGLDRATGSVITYLDDDNTMDPLWLIAVANTFDRHPEISVLYGARLVDDQLKMGGRGGGGLPALHFKRFDRPTLKERGLVDMNTIAHRRDHPEARFDESLSAYADRDLMVRLTRDRAPFELPAIACEYSTQAVDRLSDRDRSDELARVLAKHGVAEDHA